MNTDQNKKRNILILCGLAVLLVVAVVLSMRGINTSAAPSGANTEQAEEVQVQTPIENAEPLAQPAGQVSPGTLVAAIPSQVARDPFAPQMFQPDRSVQSNSVANSNPGRVSTPSFPQISLERIPPFIGDPEMSVSTDTPSASGNVVQAADPTRELKLTGVIEGAMNLAIIRGADNTRYIVREGQRVDGKYTVGHISKTSGVKIRYQGKEFVLRLGGNVSSENGTRV